MTRAKVARQRKAMWAFGQAMNDLPMGCEQMEIASELLAYAQSLKDPLQRRRFLLAAATAANANQILTESAALAFIAQWKQGGK